MRAFFIVSALLATWGVVSITNAQVKSKDKVQAYFDKQGKGQTISIEVAPGFHVNEKAPNTLTILPTEKTSPPIKVARQMMVFENKSPLSGKQTLRVSAFVCDDELTTCETHEWIFNAKGEKLTAGDQAAASKDAAAKTKAKTSKPKMKYGFYLDNLDYALNEATKTKKLALLVFSARWCPGCMRMENEVWTNKEIQSTLGRFVRVKLDSDRFANKSTMEKYGVRGIPTMMVLNAKGEELERFVDYQELSPFKNSLIALAKTPPQPRGELVKAAEAGDSNAAMTLGRRAALSYQTEDAMNWFAKATPAEREKSMEYWWAATTHADDELGKKSDDKDLQNKSKDIYAKAMKAFPESLSALDWSLRLAELQGAESRDGKKTLEELVKTTDGLIADRGRMQKFITPEPVGDMKGFESLRVFQAKAEALAALKRKDDEMKAWKAAVTEGDQLQVKEISYGPYFRFLPILKKAKENERITAFFERELKKDPKDGEILRRYSRFLFDNGNYEKASELAKRSIASSYDDNEIFAATLYASSLQKLGQTNEARQVLLSYQARPDLPKRAKKEIQTALSEIK